MAGPPWEPHRKGSDRSAGSGPDELPQTLESPAAGVALPPQSGRSPSASGRGFTGQELERGTRVERYVILKSVGQGGMGVVYAAYDPELDRKVALKLLLPDSAVATNVEGRARLLREAQAMARISHPNVISIYDVGTFDTQVFIAMEFIQGGSLRDWLRERPRPWRELLQAFLEAGRGLAAAHQAGLVHRDFKPANVLRREDGRVCVMDFGLARLADASQQEEAAANGEDVLQERATSGLSAELTAAGVVLGTPQYMPPEQYMAHAGDARLDQFSFCASLYWALYGQRPFEPKRMAKLASEARSGLKGQDLQEFGRRLPQQGIVQEPPRDSVVPARVRLALLRGLSLDPAHRFASMEALLEALSPPQPRARQGWMVAVGAAALSVLGTGLYVHHQSQVCAGAAPLMAAVWSPQAQQKLETAFTATGAHFATESALRVTQLLNGYASSWTRMHTEACEATRVRGEQPESLLALRMVCLERRRRDMGALVSLLSEADTQVVERSVDAAVALPSLEPCQDISSLPDQPPLPADPARRAVIEQLGNQLSRLRVLYDGGRYKAGLELARTLEPEVAATAYRPLQAELGYHLGRLLEQTGEAEAGIIQLEHAFEAAEASRADRTRLEVLTRLIVTQANNGHAEQAQRWGQVAVAILERLGGEPSLAADLMINLGNVSLLEGHFQEAWDSFSKARVRLEALQPGHPKQAKVSYGLGQAALHQGKSALAIQMLTEALQQTEAAKGSQHPEMGLRHVALSTALRESGAALQALPHAEAALQVRSASLGADHPAVADALDELGECLFALARYEPAMKAFSQAVDIKSQRLGKDHPDLSYSYDGLGKVLLAQGKASQATPYLRKALAYEEAGDEALAGTGFLLAQALWDMGNEPQQARAEALRARARYAKLAMPQQVAELDAWLQARPDAPHPSPSVKPNRHKRR